jgi:hypothetical protein
MFGNRVLLATCGNEAMDDTTAEILYYHDRYSHEFMIDNGTANVILALSPLNTRSGFILFRRAPSIWN